MKLKVTDLIQVDREVELPTECPGCKSNLHDVGLSLWEYQDQKRPVDIELNDEGHRCLEFTPALPSVGEHDLPVSWHCHSCDYMLAQGHHEQPHDPEFIATLKETFGWDDEKSTDTGDSKDSSAAPTES